MKLDDLKLSVKQVVAVCGVVFAVGGAAVQLDNVGDDVQELKAASKELTATVSDMKLEQARLTPVVNFLLGEALKEGWTPSKYDFQAWSDSIEEAKK